MAEIIGQSGNTLIYMDPLTGQISTGPSDRLEARTPSVAEDVAGWLGDKITRIAGADPRRAYQRALGAVDAASFVPGPGTALSLAQAGRSLGQGDYGTAAIEGGIGLLDLAGIGAARNLPRFLSAGDAAARLDRINRLSASGYGVGDRLVPASAASGYAPAINRPGLLSLPEGGRFEARQISPIEQAASDYMRSRGERDFKPLASYPEFSDERARAIALAYDQMKNDPQNPAVKRAYDAMIQETLDQYKALKDTGIDFRFLREGMEDPYAASPALGYKDLVENGRLWVFPTDFGFGTSAAFDPRENPLLIGVGRIGDKENAVANDAFRAVHDAYGHFGPGNPFFRHKGEERAWIEHSRMYSPEARGAMTSETRGQNSWLNFGPYGAQNRSALGADTVFADQKAGLMPEWTSGLLSPADEALAIADYLKGRSFR